MGFCLKLHRSDAVILAVTNVKRAALDEDAVRPLEAASESIAVRAIAAVAGPDDGRNYSRSQIDASNDMAFCVGYIKCAFSGIRDAFGSVKFRGDGRSAVSRVPGFTSSCNQLELPPRDIEDRVRKSARTRPVVVPFGETARVKSTSSLIRADA